MPCLRPCRMLPILHSCCAHRTHKEYQQAACCWHFLGVCCSQWPSTRAVFGVQCGLTALKPSTGYPSRLCGPHLAAIQSLHAFLGQLCRVCSACQGPLQQQLLMFCRELLWLFDHKPCMRRCIRTYVGLCRLVIMLHRPLLAHG